MRSKNQYIKMPLFFVEPKSLTQVDNGSGENPSHLAIRKMADFQFVSTFVLRLASYKLLIFPPFRPYSPLCPFVQLITTLSLLAKLTTCGT